MSPELTRLVACLLASLALVLAPACATHRSRGFDEDRVARGSAVEPAPTEGSGGALAEPTREATRDPQRAKAAIRTPEQCEGAARAQLQVGERDAAFTLLGRCAELDAFYDLRPLMSEPWRSELRRRGEGGVRLLARIAARGGANMAVDLALLRDAGFDLWPLKGAEKEPEAYRRRHVIVRGRLEWREDGETKRLVVVELVPRNNDDVYLKERYGHVYLTRDHREGWSYQPSGRELVVAGGPGECTLGQKELQIVLARIDQVEPTSEEVSPDPSEETVFRGRGRLIDCRPDFITATEGTAPWRRR